jgi:HK97 family phage prohead protease/HK97 family phage major capsid protein
MKTLPKINSRCHRSVEIRQPQDTETGLVIELAASSDIPYRRNFGYETLLHTEEAIDYSRVAAGSCPLLYNHNNDEYIGIVESVRLDNGQLRAVVRLSKNSDFARQVSADILDGILRSISIGYEINEMAEGEDIDGIPQYIATRWTLYEVSVVTTPADYIKAGIGRSEEQPNEDTDMKKRDLAAVMEMLPSLSVEDMTALLEEISEAVNNQVEAMGHSEEEMEAVSTEIAEEVMEEGMEVEKTYDEMGDKVPSKEYDSYESIDGEASQEEEQMLEGKAGKKSAPKANSRSNTGDKMSNVSNGSVGADNTVRLAELAAKYEKSAELPTWIKEGRTAEEVALEILDSRSNAKKAGPAIHVKSSDKPEFASAVKSWLQGNNSELAERGIDQARATGRTVTPGTLYIPTDVAMIRSSFNTRAGTAYSNTGQYAVGKEFLTFEEALREGALLSRVGGQVLSLNDVASMPYFSVPTVATASLTETASIADNEVTVGIKNWTPNRIAARYVFSNLMTRLNGTYDFEAELYNDLLAESVRVFDAQCWGGSGTNAITGLSRDTNITALSLTGSMALASASAMITEVAAQNANLANAQFVADHTVYSQMFSTQAFGAGSGMSILDVIQASHPVVRTGYLPEVIASRKTIMFGDFSKVTAATFGPVEIKRDDLTKLQTGQTVLNLEMFADCVARQPKALVRWTNVTY